MYKFNNNTIFTGYIKQVLASFNLPMCPVLQSEDEAARYAKIPGSTYILNDQIIHQGSTDSDSSDDGDNKKSTTSSEAFIYNKEIPNFTKKLQITNILYDAYTHEYLGDYLRFMRDYNHLDLMSMYNCFSNNICTNLKLTVKKDNTVAVFNTADSNYKIYMVPVKFFRTYTIAIDAKTPIEVVCGIYNKRLYTDTVVADIKYFQTLANLTYKKFNNIQFSLPQIYDLLAQIYDLLASTTNKETAEVMLQKLLPFEKDLKLFIKIPFNNDSSITILEGTYQRTNDDYLCASTRPVIRESAAGYCAYNKQENKYLPLKTKGIPGYETTLVKIDPLDIPYWLQWTTEQVTNPARTKTYNFGVLLTSNNTGAIIKISNPRQQLYRGTTEYNNLQDETVFVEQQNTVATRQPVYQQNKVIVNFDATTKNNTNKNAGIDAFCPIYKLQLLQQNTHESYPFADRLLEYLLYNVITDHDEISDNVKRVQKALKTNGMLDTGLSGLWDKKLQCAVYAYLTDDSLLKHFQNAGGKAQLFDISGFIDKDAEIYYTYLETDKDGNKTVRSLAKTNIYTED